MGHTYQVVHGVEPIDRIHVKDCTYKCLSQTEYIPSQISLTKFAGPGKAPVVPSLQISVGQSLENKTINLTRNQVLDLKGILEEYLDETRPDRLLYIGSNEFDYDGRI